MAQSWPTGNKHSAIGFGPKRNIPVTYSIKSPAATGCGAFLQAKQRVPCCFAIRFSKSLTDTQKRRPNPFYRLNRIKLFVSCRGEGFCYGCLKVFFGRQKWFRPQNLGAKTIKKAKQALTACLALLISYTLNNRDKLPFWLH